MPKTSNSCKEKPARMDMDESWRYRWLHIIIIVVMKRISRVPI